MQLTFSMLRTKEVINTQDGKKLGKVCDVVLCHPENKWIGIVVPNGRSWNPKKNGLFIDFKQVVKIGEDVILVSVGTPRRQNPTKQGHGMPVSSQTMSNGSGFDPYATMKSAGVGPRNYEEFE